MSTPSRGDASPPDADQKGRAKVEEYAKAVAQALVSGRPVGDLINEMVRQGWPRQDAEEFIARVETARQAMDRGREAEAVLRRGYLWHAIFGVGWIALGVLIITLSNPQRDRSPMGVAVLAFGVVELVWAGRQWMKTK